MKPKHFLAIASLFFCPLVFAQVGIGNTNPQATLDISATNSATPSNEDGILIPRIDEFPAVNPGAAQDGMMVFVTGNGTPTEGFYYWDNGTTSWVSVGGGVDTQNTLDEAYDEGGAGTGRTITADNGAVLIQGNDGVQNTGTFGSGATLALSGAGTRMFFYPRKAAFRAGNVTATQWNDANIGDYSVAMGRSTIASGTYDVAIGFGSTASGTYSTAMGWANTASGAYSFSLGQNATASGWSSTALGRVSTASGSQSMVFGHGLTVSGANSIGIGNNGTLSGGNSITIGNDLIAPSGYEVAVGNYNTTYVPNSTTAIDNADRLFSVGNGTSTVARSNALSIYKDGTLNINDAYNMPLADGTAGQVMTTDGAGNVTFQNTSGGDDDWYTAGTTTAPTAITDNVVTQGTVTLGNDNTGATNAKLTVKSDVSSEIYSARVAPEGTASSAATRYGIYTLDSNITPSGSMNFYSMYNSLSTTHTGTAVGLFNDFSNSGGVEFGLYNRYNSVEGVTGLRNEFLGTTTGTAQFVGVENRLLGSETYAGTVYGMNNILFAEGNGVRYGVYNTLAGSGTGNKYGSYNSISSAAGGIHYGVYSQVEKATGYAGYFIGRASFGTDSTIGRYLMPTSDGTAGQVMTTDGSGQLSFSTISAGSGTLDEAYDYGGPGAGRTINAEDGAVFINRNTDAAGSGLEISLNSTYTLSQRSAIRTYNAYPGLETYNNIYRTGGPPFGEGFLVTNESTANINGKDGVVVEFNQTSTANFGNDNRGFLYNVTYNGGSAASLYGFKAEIEGSGAAPKYGVHVAIPTSSGGFKIGLYSDVQNTTNGFAGYFIGRTSLGTGTTNRYLMPTADGTAGQVVTTDGAGQLSFTTLSLTDTQNTLDEAYDEGGAGAGRTVNVDSGSLEFLGSGSTTYTNVISHLSGGNGMQINTSGNLTSGGQISNGIEMNNSINTNGSFSRNYGIFNKMTTSGTATNGVSYGFRNWYLPAGNDAGTLYGFYADNQNTGNNLHYGYYSSINNNGNGAKYGFASDITGTGTGDKYGLDVSITSTAGGTHYGVHSNVQKATGYAAYLIGRTSLGNATTNRYLMPGADGTAGQVMTTDGAGNVTFQSVAASNDADWYEEGTTNPPSNNSDDIFTEGNVGIGISTVQYPLDISSPSATRTINLLNENNGSSATGIYNRINESSTSSNGITNGITNLITKTNQSSISGVSNYFSNASATNGFGYLFGYENSFGTSTATTTFAMINRFQGTTTTAYGISNLIGGPMTTYYGLDNHTITGGSISSNFYGVYNQLTGSSSGVRYGVYTSFAETGSGNKYGEYINIASTAGGTHFGVYSDVQKSTGYAAFLIGRTSLGNATTNRYIMPGADGTAGQVITTDGAGNLSWATATGESTTASNGLTESGNDVQLGGTLTQATTINQGNFGMTFNLTGTGDFLVQDNGADAFTVEDSGEVGIGTATPASKLDVRELSNTATNGVRIVKTDNTSTVSYGATIDKTSSGTGSSYGMGINLPGTGTGSKYGMEIYMTATGTGVQYALRNAFSSTANVIRRGVYNSFSGTGTGTRYGITNDFNSNVTGAQLGVNNIFDGSSGNYEGLSNEFTGSSTGSKVGTTNEFTTNASGTQYGFVNTFDGATSSIQRGLINQFNAGSGSQYAVYNTFSSTAPTTLEIGMYNLFNNASSSEKIANVGIFGTSATGDHTGASYYFDGSSSSTKKGLYANFANSTVGTLYGLDVLMTTTDSGTKYGVKVDISANATGTSNYGIYSNVNTADGWAGYFTGKNYVSENIGINNPSPDGRLDIIHNSTGATSPHIMLTAENANTGARIVFDNETETTNNWVLFARADDTSTDSRFNIFHNGTGNIMVVTGDGKVGINRTPATNALEVNGDASKTTAGAWAANSDRRLKKEITSISGKSALDKIQQMRGVTYLWNDTQTGIKRPENLQYGFIAQELMEVFPEKVTMDNLGYYQTAYGDYDPIFVEAIKELKLEVDTLKEENDSLKKLIEKYKNLEARLSALEDEKEILPSETANTAEER